MQEKLEEYGVYTAWGSLKKKEYHHTFDLSLIMLAAGNSRRFGSNKLLYEIDGVPMYLRTLEKLQKAARRFKSCGIIVVTQYEEIAAKAQESGVRVLINPHPERGISSSMQIGLAAAKESSGMPFYCIRPALAHCRDYR